MTRRLLAALGELHAPVLAQVALALLAVPLLLPALAFDVVGVLARRARKRALLAKVEVACPRGHVVELTGAWSCGSCQGTFEGHAWSSCPHCGAVTHATSCPCGLSVVNPLSPVYE